MTVESSRIDAEQQVAVHVEQTAELAGRAAAAAAAGALRTAIADRGRARLVLAAAPSQQRMLTALLADDSVDFSRVEALHMDDYLGLPPDHPRSFGNWLAERLSVRELAAFHRFRPDTESAAEAQRYTALLRSAPIDLTCLGIGMNGHIAFNEPDDTDFDDPAWVREVILDPRSRQQQVDEGLFATLDDVPTRALTVTVPALLSARTIVATILGQHKAEAVHRSLTGPIGPACPGTALRTHPDVSVYLDREAASRTDLP